MDDISFNDFKLEKILGQGAFGEVHRAIWKQDGKTYAVKKIIHKYKGRKDRCV
jgi:serine/threonine protein kinase